MTSTYQHPKRHHCCGIDDRLIEAVRKRRPLWDSTSSLHKNVRVLMYCWRQVSKEVEMDEHVIKRKWKHLRDYFFKQVRDMENKNMSGERKRCLWPLYDTLMFLLVNKTSTVDCKLTQTLNEDEKDLLEEVRREQRDYDAQLRNYVNTASPKPLNPTISSSDPMQVKVMKCETPPLQPIASASSRSPSEIMPEIMNPISLSEPPPLIIFKPTNISKNVECPSPSDVNTAPSAKRFKTEITEFDADLCFFKSLLPFMRALPMKEKLNVRNGIQDLILGELEAINSKNDPTIGETTPVPDEDPLDIHIDEDSVSSENTRTDEMSDLNGIVVKEEIEDDKTLLFEVHSHNFTFKDIPNN